MLPFSGLALVLGANARPWWGSSPFSPLKLTSVLNVRLSIIAVFYDYQRARQKCIVTLISRLLPSLRIHEFFNLVRVAQQAAGQQFVSLGCN